MNEFERLLAYLKIAHNNLTTLHRNLIKDVAWFGNHPQLGEWYGSVFDQLDDLTEIGLAIGYREPSIKDALLAFGGDVLETSPRKLEESYHEAFGAMEQIIALMQAAEKCIGVTPDVVNKLQEYEYYWRKESRYKLAHAFGSVKGAPMEDDD